MHQQPGFAVAGSREVPLGKPLGAPAPDGRRAAAGDRAATAVFIVGAHDLAYVGLRLILGQSGFVVTGTGRRLRDLDVALDGGTRDVLIIFDAAHDVQSTIDDICLARQRLSACYIVALFEGFQDVVDRLPSHLGANAVLDRNVSCEALVRILDAVLAGYGVLSPIVRAPPPADRAPAYRAPGEGPPAPPPQARTAPGASLSEREFDILNCIAEGQSNKVIARRFSISEATVKIHVRGILRKINVRNRTQAALWALHRGFGTSALSLD